MTQAQQNALENADTLSRKRIAITGSSIGLTWAGSMTALYQVWYKNEELVAFHTFDDGANWLQMDKAGHVYTNYKISRLTGNMFKWAGMKDHSAALIGTGIGLGYQTTLEFFDGYSSGWGFSWYDMGANTLGGAIYLGQELAWGEERIIPKFSFHPTDYAELRPNILGSNFPEQLLKDYNGQTYWLSFNPTLFYKGSTFPKWLCLSFGYSADAKIVGDQEIYTDPAGKTYHSQREFLFSLDVDFSRLPVKRPWLKKVLDQLNYLKIPFPALILTNGKLFGSPFYF
jgi:hypothetical protein